MSLDVTNNAGTTTITISITDGTDATLLSDQDVIDALTTDIGVPIRSINGLLPDVNRNFQFTGEDCSQVTLNGAGITLGNPCATPCCPEDVNIEAIKESITNLNQKYADLFRFYEETSTTINQVQGALMTLGTTI